MAARLCVALVCFGLLGVAWAATASPSYGGHPHREYEPQYNSRDGYDSDSEQYKYKDSYGYGSDEYKYRDSYGHGSDEYKYRERREYEDPHKEEEYYPEPKHEEYITVSLQEKKVEVLVEDPVAGIYSWKSSYVCPDNRKTHPSQCGEDDSSTHHSRSYRHGTGNFLQDALTPDYAGECTFTFTNLGAAVPMCIDGCWTIDITCSILHSAEKCADCPLPPGVMFNATGYVRTFDALSCSQTYTAPGFDPAKRKVGGASAKKPAAAPKAPATGRALLAADAADYKKVNKAYQPHNNITVYDGIATLILGDIISVYSRGYEYNYEEKLLGGKIFYIGGFADGQPYVLTDENATGYNHGSYYGSEGYSYDADYVLPFITPGSFKLVAKKH